VYELGDDTSDMSPGSSPLAPWGRRIGLDTSDPSLRETAGGSGRGVDVIQNVFPGQGEGHCGKEGRESQEGLKNKG
jgi:hypothetical protein